MIDKTAIIDSKAKLDKKMINRWSKYICIPLNQNFKMNVSKINDR